MFNMLKYGLFNMLNYAKLKYLLFRLFSSALNAVPLDVSFTLIILYCFVFLLGINTAMSLLAQISSKEILMLFSERFMSTTLYLAGRCTYVLINVYIFRTKFMIGNTNNISFKICDLMDSFKLTESTFFKILYKTETVSVLLCGSTLLKHF